MGFQAAATIVIQSCPAQPLIEILIFAELRPGPENRKGQRQVTVRNICHDGPDATDTTHHDHCEGNIPKRPHGFNQRRATTRVAPTNTTTAFRGQDALAPEESLRRKTRQGRDRLPCEDSFRAEDKEENTPGKDFFYRLTSCVYPLTKLLDLDHDA